MDLFFVLSGFLIGGTLINEIESTKSLSLKRFWAKRVFKILPSYFFLLIALTTLGAVTIPANEAYIHIFFLQNYLDPTTFGPTWTLAVEEHFYLVLPLALIVLIKLGARNGVSPLSYLPVLSLCIIAIVWGLRIENGISGVTVNDFMQSHFRADALFAGVLAHYLWRYQHAATKRLISSPITLAVMVVLLCPPFFWSRNEATMFVIGFSSLTVGYTLLVLYSTCLGFGVLRDNPAVRVIAAIGRWSYNIYLWHFFIGMLEIPGYKQAQQWIAASVSNVVASFSLQVLLFGTMAVLLGYAMTRLVEEPFMKLRRRVLAAPVPQSAA